MPHKGLFFNAKAHPNELFFAGAARPSDSPDLPYLCCLAPYLQCCPLPIPATPRNRAAVSGGLEPGRRSHAKVPDNAFGISGKSRLVVWDCYERHPVEGGCDADQNGAGLFLSSISGEMARVTGLEPAASGVTGRRSNQLSYTPQDGAAPDRLGSGSDDLKHPLGGVKRCREQAQIKTD